MARLTDRAVQSHKASTADRWMSDAGAHGTGRLVLRIRAATAGGAKSFYFRYTDSAGKRDVICIGPYDPKGDGKAAYTLAQARDRAREWSGIY